MKEIYFVVLVGEFQAELSNNGEGSESQHISATPGIIQRTTYCGRYSFYFILQLEMEE